MAETNFWCVSPDTTEVPFTATVRGESRTAKLWLKNELTVGEEKESSMAGFRSFGKQQGREGAEVMVDWKSQSFARACAWIADWDLTDGRGNKLPIGRATVEALRGPVFDAMEAAINAHVEAMTDVKKAPSGDAPSSATSD